MDNNLPNEIFSKILGHLDFEYVDEFLNLRLVSQHWKIMVEDFCLRTRSLHFNSVTDQSDKIYSYKRRISDNFFGAVKIKNFLQVQIKHSTTLDRNLSHLLLRLFPNIERLVIGCNVKDRSTLENFFFLIYHWKNISTLSLGIFTDPCYHSEIASTINGLKKLTHLDIGPALIPLHNETLSRIRHLSVGFMTERVSQILCLIAQIGKNCNSLWISMPRSLNSKIILPWIDINPSLFNRLTHFGCFAIDNDAYEFISDHFPSLQTLNTHAVCNWDMFAKMNCKSRLNEIRLLRVNCLSVPDLSKEISEARPMTNIHIFELRFIYCHTSRIKEVNNKDIEILCTRLAWLLPNIKHLILVVPSMVQVEIIKKNLYLFKNLCTYKVKDWEQIDEL